MSMAGIELPPRIVRAAPHPQNALDIFKGDWVVKFPEELGLTAGQFPGDFFNDYRLAAAEEAFGGFQGRHILELGPFEGHHSTMMARRGAVHVTAIEANTRAFLKCLVTKEVMGLANVSFLLGEAVKFMEQTQRRFDVLIASGVLYHFTRPDQALSLMARVSDRLFLQTHYFDEALISRTRLQGRFTMVPRDETGAATVYHRMTYLERDSPIYNGGVEEYTHWLTRDDILALLQGLGFELTVLFEEPEHRNGPTISIVAIR